MSDPNEPERPQGTEGADEKPEPAPGSTEWLLAQLSGGRITSRRERREAEQALEEAGVEPPPPPQPSPPPAPDEPVDPEAAPPTEEPGGAETQPPLAAEAGEAGRLETSEPEAASIPFMWNLTPTDEPDPFVVHQEPSEPEFAPAEPAQVTSAAPLFVPKPRAEEPPAEQAPQPSDAEQAEPEGVQFPLSAKPFDPFEQDLFNPHPEIATPIPSVDEFTVPDEPGDEDDAEPDAAEEHGHITSDWSDVAAMFGAEPVDVEPPIAAEQPKGASRSDEADGFDTQTEPAPQPSEEEPAPQPSAAEIPTEAMAAAELSAAAEPAATQPMAGALVPSPAAAGTDFDHAIEPAAAPPHPVTTEHARAGAPMNRWLILVAAVLVAALLAIALFALGRAVANGRDQKPVASATHSAAPSPTASATPTPTPSASETPAVPATGALPAGATYPWDQFRGGECIDPFTTPWAESFTVVDCNAQHAAQLVYTAAYSTDPAAAFPGTDAIGGEINLLCSRPGIIDMTAAAPYNDLQIVASYPVTQDQWDNGQRNYYCFVDRSSGQPLTASVAGAGPSQ